MRSSVANRLCTRVQEANPNFWAGIAILAIAAIAAIAFAAWALVWMLALSD